MPSASTTGIPSRDATVTGIVEYSQPASIGMMCVVSRSRCSCSAMKAWSASSPLGSFSTITVGAPIIADGTTSASSGTSSTSTIVTGPYSRIAARASSLPTYGLPPPPVPRIAAPTARSSRCSSVNCRNGLPSQLEISHRLHADAGGAARQVAERHLVHVHDANGLLARARRGRAGGRLALGLRERFLAAELVQREDPVDLAADLADRRADRVGHGEVRRLDQLRGSGQRVAEQHAPAADDHYGDRVAAR